LASEMSKRIPTPQAEGRVVLDSRTEVMLQGITTSAVE